MGAIQDRLVLQKYIEIADDENGPIRSQDFFSCISSIARNRNGENLAWGYIRENWQRLIERFGLHERSLGYLIPSVTGRFATQTRLDEMNIFFAKYPDAGAGANSRISAVGTVKQNINWLKENKNSIKQWLVKNLKSNNQ
jgi:glutamyl aminopeptidase